MKTLWVWKKRVEINEQRTSAVQKQLTEVQEKHAEIENGVSIRLAGLSDKVTNDLGAIMEKVDTAQESSAGAAEKVGSLQQELRDMLRGSEERFQHSIHDLQDGSARHSSAIDHCVDGVRTLEEFQGTLASKQATLEEQMREFERSVQAKWEHHLSAVEQKLVTLEKALSAKVEGHLGDVCGQLQTLEIASRETTLKVEKAGEDIQQGHELVSSIQAEVAQQTQQITHLQTALEELENGRMECVSAAVAELKTQTSTLETTLNGNAEKVDAFERSLRLKIEYTEQSIQSRSSAHEALEQHITAVSKAVGKLESVASDTQTLDADFKTFKRELVERVASTEMQQLQLSGAVTGLRADVAHAEQALADRASNDDISRLQDSVTTLEASVGQIESLQNNISYLKAKSLEDLKAHNSVLQQIQSMQASLDSVENDMTDKINFLGAAMERQLSEAVLGVQEQLADASHLLQDTPTLSQMRQLEEILASVQSESASLDGMHQEMKVAIESKLDIARFDRFERTNAGCQDKVDSLWKMEQMFASVQKQVTDVESSRLVAAQKADQDYRDLMGAIAKKAEKTYVDHELQTTVGDLMAAIAKKAEKSYVDHEVQTKAGEVYSNADFDKKRMKQYLDTELLKKVDIAYVQAELDRRPLKEEVANAVMAVMHN